MISLESWKKKHMLVEFAGPVGQVDPNGFSQVQMPSVVPSSPVGSARPGMASSAMMTPPAQPENSPTDELPNALQTFMRVLGNKPAMQIISIRNKFNSAVQQLLMGKSNSAGRMGMMNNFNQARDMKANFGQPPVN